MKSTVYRCFDKNGILLYVGSTINIQTRLERHKHKSLWYRKVETIKLKHFANKQKAYAEEIRACMEESPKLNKQLNPNYCFKTKTFHNK